MAPSRPRTLSRRRVCAVATRPQPPFRLGSHHIGGHGGLHFAFALGLQQSRFGRGDGFFDAALGVGPLVGACFGQRLFVHRPGAGRMFGSVSLGRLPGFVEGVAACCLQRFFALLGRGGDQLVHQSVHIRFNPGAEFFQSGVDGRADAVFKRHCRYLRIQDPFPLNGR